MATPAQILANQANALKSTGPRTPEGKAASRRNAIKHGFAAETLVLPDEEAEAIAVRVAQWTAALDPAGQHDDWLIGEVALATVRVERCRAVERALRTQSVERASACWEVDREAEAVELGARLGRSPELVGHKLRRTKQGCAWLIGRWEGLRRILVAEGDWTDAQETLALDLCGTPQEFRQGPTELDGDRLAMVDAQLEYLGNLKARAMDRLDDQDRAAAEVGIGRDIDKPLALLHRYESACDRRLEKAMKQLGWKERPATPAPPRVAFPLARSIAVAPPVAAAQAPRPPLPIVETPPVKEPLTGEGRRARRAKLARALRRG